MDGLSNRHAQRLRNVGEGRRKGSSGKRGEYFYGFIKGNGEILPDLLYGDFVLRMKRDIAGQLPGDPLQRLGQFITHGQSGLFGNPSEIRNGIGAVVMGEFIRRLKRGNDDRHDEPEKGG